ncbi:Uncharacterized protein RNJ44_00017 [Nakaseomyces bracarensis]|uniref:Protein DOM34 homolog n=1 Tax=Nakaseomyces bracarensis TaxID=273131 RepID=A0ABR4P104_9SACH
MKVLSMEKGKQVRNQTVLTIVPENKEDLFAMYQIIDIDDIAIFKKLYTNKNEDTNKKTTTDLARIKLRILSREFDIRDEYLRYKGVSCPDDTGSENIDSEIPIGKYISFSIAYNHPITLYKTHFNKYAEQLLLEATMPEAQADTAAVVLQEGISHICLLTASSTIMKQKVEFSMPKKKNANDVAKFETKMEKFYRATYDAIKKQFDFDQLRMIILCSPGFYAKTLFDNIIKYANEEQNDTILSNQSIFIVAHCSTGYLQGISEVLKNPEYSSLLEDTKFVKETLLFDNFLEHIESEDDLAWYGRCEIYKAVEMEAVDTLLITSDTLRSDNIVERENNMDLIELVKNQNGKVVIFSNFRDSGVELQHIGGFACILKYPVVDLDDIALEFPPINLITA